MVLIGDGLIITSWLQSHIYQIQKWHSSFHVTPSEKAVGHISQNDCLKVLLDF